MKRKRIFLDMDGVIVDWNGGVLQLIKDNLDEFPSPDIIQRFIIATYEGVHITDAVMNRLIDRQGSEFWADLKPLPHAKRLIKAIKDVPNSELVFLSSPSVFPHAYHGKCGWLENMGHDPGLLVMATDKSKLASTDPKAYLIDDLIANVYKFESAGGFGYWWDSRHSIDFTVGDAIGAVVRKITE